MKSVLEELMVLPVKKKGVYRAHKNMSAGKVWEYSFHLSKGGSYLVETQTYGHTKTVYCSLMNVHEGFIVRGKSGTCVSFTIVPINEGAYKVSVTNEATHKGTESGKVTISVTKASPSRQMEANVGGQEKI